MDAISLIKDLEREIELDKAELAEKGAEIAIKEKLLDEWKSKLGLDNKDAKKGKEANIDAQPQKAIPDTGVIDVNSLLDEQPRKPTIIDEIRDIVERFGSQEFTVQHVDRVYKLNHNIPAEDISNRTKISTALSKLKDLGVISMALKGSGNVPHKYVLVQQHSEISDLI